MSETIKDLATTNDVLESILSMAPKLNNDGQMVVYGMMCGLVADAIKPGEKKTA